MRGFRDADTERADLVDVVCDIERFSTERAFAVRDDAGEVVWIPRSQAEYAKLSRTLTLPRRLAAEKGLI